MTEIPATGWKDILLRVKREISSDHVGLTAAGVAFYALLALFPAITALMALSGLVLAPDQVTQQLDSLSAMLPEEAAAIILDQAVAVAGSQDGGLGLAFVVGVGLAIYSASKGMASLMEGLNIAYDEAEERGFIRRTLVTLALTVFLIIGLLLAVTVTLGLPAAVKFLTLPDWIETGVTLVSWAVLAAMTVVGLAVLYRYGPCRDNAEWHWLTPGALTACVVWLAASVGFSLYVSNFASYNESFGSMAGVIILLMWLWISAFIVLLGAELNAEIEAQTKTDTTVGESKPMGQRGAQKADNLGAATG